MLDFPRSSYKCIQQDIESCSHYGLILYGLNFLNILAMLHGDTVLWNKMSGFFFCCYAARCDTLDIVGELKDVYPKWYEVGVALRMPVSELDDIQFQNLEGFEKQFSVYPTKLQ